MNAPEHERKERMTQAYNRMLERVKHAWQRPEGQRPSLKESLEQAREKAAELGELSREEAERIADYLRRDLKDAAEYLSDSGREMEDWLRFDLQRAEVRLAQLFADVVDQSRVELAQWEEQAQLRNSGEVTGVGTLECVNCGELLHFTKTGHIPPCPKCHGTVFRKGYTIPGD